MSLVYVSQIEDIEAGGRLLTFWPAHTRPGRCNSRRSGSLAKAFTNRSPWEGRCWRGEEGPAGYLLGMFVSGNAPGAAAFKTAITASKFFYRKQRWDRGLGRV